jgi:GT2 family glycosyltransferase
VIVKLLLASQKYYLGKNKNLFEYAGACGGYLDTFGYPFCRGRIFDFCETDNKQYNTVEKIFWASGAALFVRSNIFHELCGFDERFFAHMEEIDLCWRMQLAGFTIAIQPHSVVYHVGGGTLPKSYQKTFLNFRNNWLMLRKNLTIKDKLYKLPIRFILDFSCCTKSNFKQRF